MPKAKQPPALADPRAQEKLEAAAKAAGLGLRELADLVVESGVAPAPQSDGVTLRYTLQDLGKRMWADLAAQPRDERAEWFSKLVPAQKAAIIVVLRDEGFRTEVIANDFGISAKDVMRTWNTYASEMGSQVVGIRLDTIVGQLQMGAEKAIEMATLKGDHAALWRINKELVSTLQSVGIVDKAIHRVEVSHKLDDQQKEELEALASLRNKQHKRLLEVEEIKEAETEEIPEELYEDYDVE